MSDFEAAIEGDMEPASETGEAAPPSDDGEDWEAAVSEPSGITLSRRGHVVSDKTRELFKNAAATIKAQLANGDEDEGEFGQPLEAETAAPPVPTPAAAPVASPTAPVAVAPAPSLDPAVQQKLQQLESRHAELEARGKDLDARAQQLESGDLGRLREMYYDKGPAHAIVEVLKMWTGASTDDETQNEVADLITELSGHALGTQVPDAIRSRLDSKRALKSVKQQQAKLDARETELAAKHQQQAQRDQVTNAIRTLDQEVRKPELVTQYPFLAVEANAGELIFETLEAQFKRDGTELRWTDAAKRVNDYLATKWREEHDKRAHLFTASPASAGGAANGTRERPQGDPQGIRRSHTLTNAAAASASTPKAPPPDSPSNGRWSNEDHRTRTKARMRAAFKSPTE